MVIAGLRPRTHYHISCCAQLCTFSINTPPLWRDSAPESAHFFRHMEWMTLHVISQRRRHARHYTFTFLCNTLYLSCKPPSLPVWTCVTTSCNAVTSCILYPNSLIDLECCVWPFVHAVPGNFVISKSERCSGGNPAERRVTCGTTSSSSPTRGYL